jgi:hypothetical protein
MHKVDQVLEALARVEIKIDALLKLGMQVLAQNGVEFDLDVTKGYTCPICGMPTVFRTNVQTGGVERICGCGTGCIPAVNIAELRKLGPAGEEKSRESGERRIESLEEAVDGIEADNAEGGWQGRRGGPGVR